MSRQQPAGARLVTALLGSPVAWALHLLGSYFIVAVWCGNALQGVQLPLAILTLVCAAAAVLSGLLGWRVWHRGQQVLRSDDEPGAPEPWDARLGERNARASFIGVLALFTAGVFTLVIILQGLPPLFAPACSATTVP